MLNLYLVRHGWTAWHSEGRLAGWRGVPLDERGRAEAAAAGRWLAAHLSSRPQALVTSPVLRALQTAELIAGSFDPDLPLQIEQGLGETRIDAWEGRLADEITANDPRWSAFYSGPADFRFPDGETGREVQARVVATVRQLREQYVEGNLILVSHADPLRGLIAHFLGLEANLYYRLRIDCGSISRLSVPATARSDRPSPRATLEFLNLTEHLRRPTASADG